jgi:hypothetical protein
MANGCLLLGSVFLFHYFIEPVSQLLTPDSSTGGSSMTSMSVWSFYHLLWVLPIWSLCYVVSLGCYQSIADEVFRLQQQQRRRRGGAAAGSPLPVDVKRSISGTVYSAFVWVFMFLLLRLFDLLLPALLDHTSRLLLDHTAAGALSEEPLSLSPSLSLSSLLLGLPLRLSSLLSRGFGLVLGGVVYGWYGFDMAWIAGGWEPEQRFRAVEEHWAYFLGFGVPYVLLLQSTSFFLGYGLYLMLFPFTLMLGAVSDYQQHYHSHRQGHRQGGQQHQQQQVVFRVFQPARSLAMRAIKALDRYLRPGSRGRRGGQTK